MVTAPQLSATQLSGTPVHWSCMEDAASGQMLTLMPFGGWLALLIVLAALVAVMILILSALGAPDSTRPKDNEPECGPEDPSARRFPFHSGGRRA